jgi:hypothetical protein
MMSTGLVVSETSLVVWNNTAYANSVPARSVSEFIRVMAANYLATDAASWTATFSNNNSGTYNNQFMVLDYNLFESVAATPSTPLHPQTLVIAEQMPGYIAVTDVTPYVNTHGFFPSFNIAYDPTIFAWCGYTAQVVAVGDFWNWTTTTRAQMFAAYGPSANDVSGVQRLIRYNDWQVDSMSVIPNCSTAVNGTCTPDRSAMLSLACRGDLAPVGNVSTLGPLAPYIGLRNHVAMDAKIASYSNYASGELRAMFINGPTTDQQAVFSFSGATDLFPSGQPPLGMPDVWNFTWISYAPMLDSSNGTAPANGGSGSSSSDSSSDSGPRQTIGAIVGAVSGALTVVCVGLFHHLRRRQRQSQSSSINVKDSVTADYQQAA